MSGKKIRKGKLKIYLGMSAGAGKTYSMLKDATDERRAGEDIVAGYIEPHGRVETESLIAPLEVLPTKKIVHRGISLEEFDLEAALKRNPKIILVDELAHTNAPGCLHNKRWLDIQALLDAGIDVYTTLNIQHLESISELVSSLCGIQVHETVPDTVLKEADSIEVIDIPPEELIARLREGKIYPEHKIDTALGNFFKEGNLLALREILLRKAAEKIDSDVVKYKLESAIKDSWATSDRIVVAVGANKFARRLIQKAVRIASSRKASLVVAFVETPHLGPLTEERQELIDDALQLALSLGASVEKCCGTDIAAEIVKIAAKTNASVIAIGKHRRRGVLKFFSSSLADRLINLAGNIDILMVSGIADPSTRNIPRIISSSLSPIGAIYALLVCSLCTGVAFILESFFDITSVAMLYILGAVVIAQSFGRAESIIASFLSIFALNFFFIEPRYTFNVNNPVYLITFVVMLVVSLSISNLVSRIRRQNEIVEKREQRAVWLYEAVKNINSCTSRLEIILFAQESAARIADVDCCIWLNKGELLETGIPSKSNFENNPQEFAVARYVMDNGKAAGMTTDVLPGSGALYLPVRTEKRLYAVAGLKPLANGMDRSMLPTIESVFQQVASCLERLELEEAARRSSLQIETESMRSLVLRAVSHDFRTPLTVIEGAAEQIKSYADLPEKVRDLIGLIIDHSKRLSRLVINALSLSRLEQKSMKINLQWESLEEIIGQALDKYRDRLKSRKVVVENREDLPLLKLDAILIDQLISNIIENSLIHAPAASELLINFNITDRIVEINFADNGPGPETGGDIKVLRSDTECAGGQGLGLAICRMIAKLHGGSVSMSERDGGGALLTISLPKSDFR